MRASKAERSELKHRLQEEKEQHAKQQQSMEHQQYKQQLQSFNPSLNESSSPSQFKSPYSSSSSSWKTNSRSYCSTMLPVEQKSAAKIDSTANNTTTSTATTTKTIPHSDPKPSLQRSSKSRLVFGLNERTNKLKHDEYAEKRISSTSKVCNSSGNCGSGSSDSRRNSSNNASQPDLQNASSSTLVGSKQSISVAANHQNVLKANVDSSNRSFNQQRNGVNENGSGKSTVVKDKSGEKEQQQTDESKLNKSQQQQATSKIRASKYGNFYKPQDLVSSSSSSTAAATTSSSSLPQKSKASTASQSSFGLSSSEESNLISASSDIKKEQQPSKVSREASKEPKRRSSTERTPVDKSIGYDQGPSRKRSLSNSNSLSLETETSKLIDQTSPQEAPPSPTINKPTKKNLTSNIVVIQDNTTAKKDNKVETVAVPSPSPSPPPSSQKAPKMQFTIPPPPQVNSSSSKNSVVNYAKSRIYNKPAKQQFGPQFQLTGQSLLNSGTIPESILSGFKPPKQVNVSKAREKWEGGEPFAKSKSRQRLAAQAGNKFPHGIWSITSVVATQQMQFQQALANSSIKSSIIKSDPSVKILTRGSVLERVQQFEKAPGLTSTTPSTSISPASSNSSISSSGSDCSSVYDLTDTEASITIGENPSIKSDNRQVILEPKLSNSKQAQYKTKVSSIQSVQNEPLTLITSNSISATSLNSPKSPILSPPIQNRRFSLRRRSSLVENSNTSIIPRFYHPNGKPNTYEIELQKKNIVACFDKFPDRKASLTSPIYRRHFHAISFACNFSEYFKEPLFLYIKHQMTQSNLLHNASGSAVRKTSGIGFASMTNGTQLNQTKQQVVNNNGNSNELSKSTTPKYSFTKNPLTRAASIDTSTMEKLQNQTYITCDQFLVCWRNIISSCFDNTSRFVHLLTFGERNYLLPDDFVPLIQSIIDDHPGLKFLRAAPDFHMRYIQTVIARIYFSINKSWTGKISLNELRQSNLLAVLQVLSQEEDINQITDYFSYEHFYVIYCKFWSLDQDHDLLISKEDLARHNDASISSRIIERIFSGVVSKQIQQTGKMSYSDFVWFLIAEEDKKHPRSIEYWFRLMDIDGDGYISMYEMEYFYYEQMKRLELMNIEALPFVDSACQILDLVNPREKNKISLSDLKRTKMATIFFDTFINLEKYLEHESREFVSTRDIVQDGIVISDWDRYASEEYESLVTEESSV